MPFVGSTELSSEFIARGARPASGPPLSQGKELAQAGPQEIELSQKNIISPDNNECEIENNGNGGKSMVMLLIPTFVLSFIGYHCDKKTLKHVKDNTIGDSNGQIFW